MQFKQEVPTKDGYYYAYYKISTRVEILRRHSGHIGKSVIVHWYAMGYGGRLSNDVISKTYFGEKVRFPRVVQSASL
jgi:hypothetical protein